jgi:SAM-dependent methyltransferase
MTELLLGCGHARDKRLAPPNGKQAWSDLVTLDKYKSCDPDLLCDLDKLDWYVTPVNQALQGTITDKVGYLADQGPVHQLTPNYFDEVHAYEVLEHLGSQGDATSFFAHFRNIHRILKPDGHLCATCPSRYSPWLWGDPSHRRAITQESLVFLSQEHITANRKAKTAMSDFTALWDLDFRIIRSSDNQRTHEFILQAIK